MSAVLRWSLIAIVAAFLVAQAQISPAQAGAIEAYDQEIPEELVQEYLNWMDMMQDASRAKRSRFCLRRDMTCPNLGKAKDVCCKGSQCSCNLFGQNCRCSPIGIFQRLG